MNFLVSLMKICHYTNSRLVPDVFFLFQSTRNLLMFCQIINQLCLNRVLRNYKRHYERHDCWHWKIQFFNQTKFSSTRMQCHNCARIVVKMVVRKNPGININVGIIQITRLIGSNQFEVFQQRTLKHVLLEFLQMNRVQASY